MKLYIIEFWHNTDLRDSKSVSALSELHALGTALNELGGNWVDYIGFSIKIKLA